MFGLHEFINNIKFTSAGYPSKKDVNRFITFLIFLQKPTLVDDSYIKLSVLNETYKKTLFVILRASHYFKFEKLDELTYRFKLPKAVYMNAIKDNQVVLSKKGLRFITKPLIEEMLKFFNITRLKDIDRKLLKLGYSNTSIKVFKQVAFEFLPLYPAFTTKIEIISDQMILYTSRWFTTKPYVVHKMLKRKLRHNRSLINDVTITDNRIIIKTKDPHTVRFMLLK